MLKANEEGIILLHTHRIEDIFFRSSIPLSCKRRLNEDVEEFIIEEAEDLPVRNNMKLMIKVADVTTLNEGEVAAMIHDHFAYRREKAEKQLTDILRLGWKSLFIACVFLLAMFFITNTLVPLLPDGRFTIVIRELFIILGWVALWRPADLLLYEWRPFKRKIKLFAKLSECSIQLNQKV